MPLKIYFSFKFAYKTIMPIFDTLFRKRINGDIQVYGVIVSENINLKITQNQILLAATFH